MGEGDGVVVHEPVQVVGEGSVDGVDLAVGGVEGDDQNDADDQIYEGQEEGDLGQAACDGSVDFLGVDL